MLFSIIETCELHKIEPYAYLRFVLTKIPYAKTVEELEQLMLFNVKPEQLVIVTPETGNSKKRLTHYVRMQLFDDRLARYP